MPKQKTLFQAWKKPPANGPQKKILAPSSVIDLSAEDVDDEDLLSATVALENQDQSIEYSGSNGFDVFTGKLWIYPTNYPVRSYQYSIVHKALFENTLVALPTGLGKTFIAAVVMYNFYRWYPQGKIVFMAPTKPLVSQQIDACYNIMGIPMEDQAQITGATMASNRREELWSSKRVFFLTPQVINNDLTRGVCPAAEIKCLVVDEAHKALGNHAYCQVVQQLLAYNRDFRVLALSATPGSDLKSVQQVLNNLLISHIEVRSEDSVDIQQYTHSRKVEKILVKLDQKILDIKEKYINVIQLFINNLVSNKALYNKDVSFLSKYAMLMSRDQFRKDPPSGLSRQTMGIIEGDFAITISLYHGLELLLQHGMKSFFIFLKGIIDGSKGNMRSKTILQSNETFVSIYKELTKLYGDTPGSVVQFTQASLSQSKSVKEQDKPNNCLYVYGHPKMKKLEEVIVNHFQSFSKTESETRVMVFCQYRDSVREITELLQTHRPLIRPMQFVGHAPSTNPVDDKSSGNKNKRFTQKDQLMVVSKFRSGGYNTLVSTCVGEEGLDIGDVDLIVCFDSHKSPIRLVQRMGRTGRKRAGRIVMLVTEGKEERDYNSSVASRKSIHKAITGAGKNLHYYPNNPRMVPQGLHPTCHKMFITVAERVSTENKRKVKTKQNTSADVSVMLKKVVQQSNDKTLLTETQQESWKTKCQLTSHEKMAAKKLPKFGQMICMDKELFQLKCDNHKISLSEWLPWQCRLQPSALVGHSSRSKLLTEVLNVCDQMKHDDEHSLQQSISSKNLPTKKAKCLKSTKTSLTKLDDQKVQLDNETLSTFPVAKETLVLSDSEVDAKADQLSDKELEDFVFNPPVLDISKNTQHDVSAVNTLEKCDEFVTPKPISSKKGFNQKKSSFSFTENLSAIFPTPLPSKSSEKVGLSCKNDEIKIPTPPPMDSLAFDFLDDINDNEDVNIKNHQRSCFQIWDSDKIQPNKTPEEKCSGEVEENKTVIRNVNTHPQPCSGEKLKTKSNSSEECHQSDNNSSLITKNSSIISVKFEDDLAAHRKNASTSKENVPFELPNSTETTSKQGVQDFFLPPKCIKNKTEHVCNTALPCSKKLKDKTPFKHVFTSSMPGVESFNMSADMFNPQFDLHFDLESDSFVGDKNDNCQEETSLKCDNHDKKEFIKPSKTMHDISCTSKADDTVAPNSLESKPTCSSVDLSQYKRKRNQELFADLSISCDHTVPVAAVKPHRFSPDKKDCGNNTSSFSPVAIQQLKTNAGLKRLRDEALLKSSDEDSESDDFVSSRKKRCLGVSKSGDTTSSSFDVTPIRVKRSNRHQILLSDEEVTSASDTSSPVLSAKTKNIKQAEKSLPTTNQALSPHIGLSSRRHSTPKVNLFEKSDHTKNSCPKQFARKKISARKMTNFLDDEAEVSVDGELMSSDEDIDEEWDEEMMKFVNDATQLTQHVAANETTPDVYAMYLKSIKSPLTKQNKPCDVANFKGKYKLAYGKGCDIDVFSQDVQPDDSVYAENSFVVDNNESESCGDLGEITILSGPNKSSNFDESFLSNRPKTRGEIKLQKAMKSKLKKENVKENKTEKRKRIIVCDDEDDSDATDIDQPFHEDANSQEYWRCPKCTLMNNKKSKTCKACDYHHVDSAPTVPSPARFCEICGGVLTMKGWLCKTCLDLVKKSEQEESGKTILSVDSPLSSSNPQSSLKSNITSTVQAENRISREERLLKSKQKQQELRSKQKNKLNSSHYNKSFLDEEKSTNCPSQNEDSFNPIKMKNLDNSIIASSSYRNRGKLVIMVDSREVNSGAGRLVQLLRTQYNVNAVVASLKTCDYAISCRTAVFRKTVFDISSSTCRQKLATNVNCAHSYYAKVYLIVEKNRVKQAKAGGNMSTSQLNHFVSNMVAILQGNVQILYSDNQDESAKLLHMLSSHELNNGHAVDSRVVEASAGSNLKSILDICISLPGVSYPCALYLCSNFRSIKSLCNSTTEDMIKKGQLSLENANKLKMFFTKKFDVQMIPG